MKAAPKRIARLASRQTSGEISVKAGFSGSASDATCAVFCAEAFLLSRDFVEAVVTCFSDKLITHEERIVKLHVDLLHLAAFERSDDNVLDAVFRDHRFGVRCSRVNPINL